MKQDLASPHCCQPDEMGISDDLLLRVQGRHPFPLGAALALTDKCNLSCAHCYNQGLNSSDELSTSEILHLLDQMKETGTLSLTLTGGEPTARPDFAEILRGVLERRFLVTLKTNGTLLQPKDIENFWEMGLCKISPSLFSSIPEKHDAFVGMSGAWQCTFRNAVRFCELGGRCRVTIVGMNWNASDIPSIIDLCEEKGLQHSVDMKITARLDGSKDPCRLRATEKQIYEALANSRISLLDPGFRPRPFPGDQPVCGIGTRSVFIRPNGEVWPCVALPWPMGNVREKPYREILSTSPVRKKVSRITWNDSEKCRNCSISWACARCPGDAFVENGDMNQPTAMECALARAKARLWEETSRGTAVTVSIPYP